MNAPAPSKNPIVTSGAMMVVGGVIVRPDKTFPTNDCSLCLLASKLVESGRNANIAILSKSEQLALEGKPGGFTACVKKQPRHMDEEVCNGFSQCTFYCLRRSAMSITRIFERFTQPISTVPGCSSQLSPRPQILGMICPLNGLLPGFAGAKRSC